jgi:hypothetical protein
MLTNEEGSFARAWLCVRATPWGFGLTGNWQSPFRLPVPVDGTSSTVIPVGDNGLLRNPV